MDHKTQETIGWIVIFLLAAFGVYSGIGTQKPSKETDGRIEYEKGEIDRSDMYDTFPDSGPRY